MKCGMQLPDTANFCRACAEPQQPQHAVDVIKQESRPQNIDDFRQYVADNPELDALLLLNVPARAARAVKLPFDFASFPGGLLTIYPEFITFFTDTQEPYPETSTEKRIGKYLKDAAEVYEVLEKLAKPTTWVKIAGSVLDPDKTDHKKEDDEMYNLFLRSPNTFIIPLVQLIRVQTFIEPGAKLLFTQPREPYIVLSTFETTYIISEIDGNGQAFASDLKGYAHAISKALYKDGWWRPEIVAMLRARAQQNMQGRALD
jgi:hypothetical protein